MQHLRTVAFLLASIVAFSCGGGAAQSAPQQTYTMKVGNCCAADFFQTVMAMQFKTLVEKRSGGQVQVQLFNNGQLGTDQDVLKGLQLGTIDAYLSGASSAQSIVPSSGVLALPFLINSDQHLGKVMSGPVGSRLKAAYEANGIHVLSFPYEGVRDLANNGRPVTSPADLSGMRVRTAAAPVYVQSYQAFGAAPTPLNFSEVYLALKQGTIQGADITVPSVVASKLDEVIKYISLLHWQYTVGLFAVSTIWFARVPKSLQKMIQAAADEVLPAEQAAEAKDFDVALAKLKSEGITVVNPDIDAFRARAQSVWDKYQSTYGQDIKDIRAAA